MSHNTVTNEWTEKGINWNYIGSSKIQAFSIPTNSEIDLPYEDFAYVYPKIVITSLNALFDDSKCGIRIRTDPGLDTERNFTVLGMMIGTLPTDPLIYAIVPPAIPNGMFELRIPSAWEGKNFMRLSVINTDSVAHHCLGFGYILAVQLPESRKEA